MNEQFFLIVATVVLLMTVGRIVFRRSDKRTDWALEVAFIRLDFPPQQRDLAQKIAAGLAEIVGEKIKRLGPEITLKEVLGWADNHVEAADLMKVMLVAFGVACDENMTFRVLVEKIQERQSQA